MKKLISLLVVAFLSTTIYAQGIEFEHDFKFQDILNRAKAEGKVVFIDCYTTWCGPCKMLTANTFPNPELGAYFNQRFINIKMDMEKGEGPEVQARFGVRAYPTLLWVDGNGEVKHRAMGYMDATALMAQAENVKSVVPAEFENMTTKYKSGARDADFMADYTKALRTASMPYDSVFEQYIEVLSSSDLKQEKHTQTIYELTNSITSPGIAQLMKNKSFYVSKYGPNVVDQKIISIADQAIKEGGIKKDEAMIKGASKLLKDAKVKDADARSSKGYKEFYFRTQNWEMYDKTATKLLKSTGLKDEKMLNETAWDYYINIEDPKLLAKAKDWAYKAVNLKNTCENNTTYAYLNYKLGLLKEAELACDYALLKSEEDGANPSSAKALKELIQAELAKKK